MGGGGGGAEKITKVFFHSSYIPPAIVFSVIASYIASHVSTGNQHRVKQ